MKNIIFLLFIIFASTFIDALIIIQEDLLIKFNYPNCTDCKIERYDYYCSKCDNENYCAGFCKSVRCQVSDYETLYKKCRCNKCKKYKSEK